MYVYLQMCRIKTLMNSWYTCALPSCLAVDTIHKYPSSKHVGRDWDKLVADIKKEEKEEKPEGDAALQQLFQQIYKDGSDDVKKAMAKSFVSPESTDFYEWSN